MLAGLRRLTEVLGTPDEAARLPAGAGAPLWLLVALTRSRYARRERAVFGYSFGYVLSTLPWVLAIRYPDCL